MMFKRIAMGASSLILFATSLNAVSSHTWVAANGNDANAGTAASPYATFATAVANTAAGGTVSVTGPGDYGPITIGQSVTIDGTGGGSIGFAGNGEGIFINPSAPADIVLRNLTIDGGGTGADAIFVASAGTTNIVHVLIDGCRMEGFAQIGVGVGSESPMYVTVRNTSIQGGTLGVRTFQNSASEPVAVQDHVTLDHVTVQGATSAGVFARNGNMDIIASVIAGRAGSGAVALEADTYATVSVQNSMISGTTASRCNEYNSTATMGAGTTVADNTADADACGRVEQVAKGTEPAPTI